MQVTVLFLVPPVVISLLSDPRVSDYDLSSLRIVTCGAAPLGKETEALFVKKMGVPCLQGTHTPLCCFRWWWWWWWWW